MFILPTQITLSRLASIVIPQPDINFMHGPLPVYRTLRIYACAGGLCWRNTRCCYSFARRSCSACFRQISWTYKKLKESSWLVLPAVGEKASVESSFCDKTTTKVGDRITTDFQDESSSVDGNFVGTGYRWIDESSVAYCDAFQIDQWQCLLRSFVQRWVAKITSPSPLIVASAAARARVLSRACPY